MRFGALGDMVILTALLRTLHARFESRIDLVLPEAGLGPLLQAQPWVGTLYPVATRKLPYWLSPHLWRLVRQLRARGPGPVWICQTDRLSHDLAQRAGYDPRWWVSQRDHPRIGIEHGVDRLLRMGNATPPALSAAGLSVAPNFAPRLVIPPEWTAETRRWLAARGLGDRPLVLVQAGNKRTMRLAPRRRRRNRKYWPEPSWGAVIDRVHASEPDAAILLLGIRLEASLNRAILKHTATAAAVNLAGDLPISRLLPLCGQALGMISVDTGPAHVAAAVGCPLVVMFDQDPSFYAPRGEHSRVEILRGRPDRERPMLSITPDAVAAAWQRVRGRSDEKQAKQPADAC
jgi:ADP-heptose:LPS heptosyltransferase